MEVQYQRLIIDAVELGLPFNKVQETVEDMRSANTPPDLATLLDRLRNEEGT